jgi:hypothetical protein
MGQAERMKQAVLFVGGPLSGKVVEVDTAFPRVVVPIESNPMRLGEYDRPHFDQAAYSPRNRIMAALRIWSAAG